MPAGGEGCGIVHVPQRCSQLSSQPNGRRNLDPFEALSLCAEIAIAVTGFSGVVLALGGRREGAMAGQDRLLLQTLLSGSLVPLVLVAIAFILGAAEVPQSTTWQICSAIHVPTVGAVAFFNLRANTRNAISFIRGGSILWVGLILVILLQLANAISIQQFWPVLVAVWWSIAVSTVSFVSLILPASAAQQRDRADSA